MAWLLLMLERRSAPASLMSAHSFTSAMIELELSVTRLRNELEPPHREELEVSTELPHLNSLARLSLPPSYRLINTRDGLVAVYLALFAEAERRSASGRGELLRGSLNLDELAKMMGESASVVLLERHQNGVSVEELSSGLAGVLKLAARGERLESLLELLIEGGFDPTEAKDQTVDWIREGLITLTSP